MKKDLIKTVEAQIPEMNHDAITKVLDSLCEIVPPSFKGNEADASMGTYGIIRGDRSFKLGNITLNMKSLIKDLPEIALALAGTITQPYLIPLAALVVWSKVTSHMEINLKKSHAQLIQLMWENRVENENSIIEERAFLLYIECLESTNTNREILQEEFQSILKDLESIKCIKKKENDSWFLVESVKETQKLF